MKETKGTLAWWRLRSIEFEFEILHRPGKYHEAADALSRLPLKATDKTKGIAYVDEDIPAFCIVVQISEPNTLPEEYEIEVGTFPTNKKTDGGTSK